jgi:hypothetical protein
MAIQTTTRYTGRHVKIFIDGQEIKRHPFPHRDLAEFLQTLGLKAELNFEYSVNGILGSYKVLDDFKPIQVITNSEP